MLLGWTERRTARLVIEALSGAGVGPVGVIDRPRLARVLAEQGRQVVSLSPKRRAPRKSLFSVLGADALRLPVVDGAFAAIVGESGDGDVESVLVEWSRVVGEAGRVVLVDAGPREELMRRVLVAGLVDVEQSVSGRAVVTSGRVRKLA